MNRKKVIITASSPVLSDNTTFTFPPPTLMTFLRTNFGSESTRSRKQRSRSRLIFRRTKRLATGAEAEPSSPKVTCIGQVKSSKTTTSRRRRFTVSKSPVLCCRWIVKLRGSMLCFSNYCRKLTCQLLRKWVSCGTQQDPSGEHSRNERTSPKGVVKLKTRSEVQPPFEAEKELSLPVPVNAFLLTRSKSTSSSLDSTRKFSSSPTASQAETETEDGENQRDEEGTVHVREDNRTSGMEQKQRDSTLKSRRDRESLKFCENRGTIVLKRCKSEPGRVMQRLVSDPELDPRMRRKSEFDCVN